MCRKGKVSWGDWGCPSPVAVSMILRISRFSAAVSFRFAFTGAASFGGCFRFLNNLLHLLLRLNLPLYGGIDPKGTPFRLAGFRQDALIYTKDGKIPTQSADQALCVVSSAAREYIAPEKRAELALTEIRKVERGASLEIISQTDETIGGAPAVVITAKTKDKAPALICQAALFHGQRVTMLVGIARGETDANLAYFQKLASTYAESPAAKNSAPAELMKRAAATGGRA